ncbi:hypothetical protein QTP86_020364 [Hemibagrus guttatus]|nr:hypothetical protein QTP86_020364 [Hemibagrus guttatus]
MSTLYTNRNRGTIKSILSSCITAWFGNCTASDRKTLQRIVRTAEKIIRVSLPSIIDMYTIHCICKAKSIVDDPTHPSHTHFTLLPSKKEAPEHSGPHNQTVEQLLPSGNQRHFYVVCTMCLLGITVDKSGYVYFVDGTTIQMINDRAVLTTFICSRGRMSTQPLSCDFRMDITQVSACYTYITISEQVKAPFGHHSLLNKSVVHSTLEAAKAIIVSYQGLLYIAETDDRKIHRIQQVSTNGEISVVAGSPSDCDCKIDPNCDCFSGSKDEADALSCMYILSCMYYTMNNKPGDGSYACDAHLKAPFSLAVAPNGTLYIADLGNIWIRSISTNRPQQTAAGMYEIISPVDQELYLFSHNGTHLHTKHLITGDFLYNFTYSADWHLKAVVSRDGSTFHVQCDSKGIPLWLVAPRGQVYWFTLSNSHFLKRVSAQGHGITQLTYHGNTGLLATKTDENGWVSVYELFVRSSTTVKGTSSKPPFRLQKSSVSRTTWSHNKSDNKSVHVEVESSNSENFIITNLSSSDTIFTFCQDHAQNMYNVNVNGSFHVTFPNVMDVTLATVVSWDGQPNNEHVHNRNLMSIAANSKIWKMKMVGWCLEHGPIAKSGASHSWRSLLCSSYIANAETFWKLTKQISFWPFSGMIKTIHVMPYGFVCTIRYRKIGHLTLLRTGWDQFILYSAVSKLAFHNSVWMYMYIFDYNSNVLLISVQ